MDHINLYIYNLHLDGKSARFIMKTLHIGYSLFKSSIIAIQKHNHLSHQKARPMIINNQIIQLLETFTLEDASLSDKNWKPLRII